MTTNSNKLFKELRLREGLSQLKLAKILKVSQPTISYIENKQISISEELNKKIYKIFKVDLLDIIRNKP